MEEDGPRPAPGSDLGSGSATGRETCGAGGARGWAMARVSVMGRDALADLARGLCMRMSVCLVEVEKSVLGRRSRSRGLASTGATASLRAGQWVSWRSARVRWARTKEGYGSLYVRKKSGRWGMIDDR